MHVSPYPFGGAESFGIGDYITDFSPIFGQRRVRCAALQAPTDELKTEEGGERAVRFIWDQLDAYPDSVGAVMVKPENTHAEIEKMTAHPQIKALKCYHKFTKKADTASADVHEYLSDEALSFANERKMAVVLHLVKDAALADGENMKKIKRISREYPDLKLILAHSARAFAAWTTVESVGELVPYENVFFDFSAICESPSITAILSRIGTSRCAWGSDYNVSARLGKAISLGDGFYWINENDIKSFGGGIRARHLIIENLMAVREACTLLGIKGKEVDDIFYDNAALIYGAEG
jgi:glutamate-1-semialdehyde 2,1-aminomutase